MPVRPTVGTTVRIKLGPHDTDAYKSRVADIDEQFLYIDIPVNPRSGRELEIHVDDELIVEYAASPSEIYRYTAQSLGIAYIPTPALRLISPAVAKGLERIQRREFFRVSIDTTVQLTRVEDGTSNQMQSVDISGGGLAVKARGQVPYRPNDVVEVSLVLPYIEYVLHARCRIVRLAADEQTHECIVSMAFENILEREREQIVRYTFMRQRALKQQQR
ncbi:hypothetical protein AAC03nite_20940 [Alicyclobacillus acidoterrestris]|nr:hypothetical protein AAC03nite_20940 [Alicyclobacillus acidoterrestris]